MGVLDPTVPMQFTAPTYHRWTLPNTLNASDEGLSRNCFNMFCWFTNKHQHQFWVAGSEQRCKCLHIRPTFDVIETRHTLYVPSTPVITVCHVTCITWQPKYKLSNQLTKVVWAVTPYKILSLIFTARHLRHIVIQNSVFESAWVAHSAISQRHSIVF